MLKKALSILLSLILLISIFTVLPVAARAEEADIAEESSDIEIAESGADDEIAEVGFSIRTSYPGLDNYYYVPGSNANPFGVNTHGGNCTWYAWGRVYEASGNYPNLPKGDAGTWYSSATCEKGSTPRPGAIICGSNHVAFVEKVYSDGVHFDYSESNWEKQYGIFNYYEYKTSADFPGKFYGFLYPFDGGSVNNPEGYFEKPFPVSSNKLKIKGWAFDKDNINESIYVDIYAFKNRIARVKADKYREDIGSQYGVGNYHGFEETITVPRTGTYNIAVYAINIGGGKDTEIYYNSVTIPDFSYEIESVTESAPNCVTIKGWAFDNDDTAASLYLDVYAFRNRVARIKADKFREDIGSIYGTGNYHGFEETIQMPHNGTFNIAVYAINENSGKQSEIYYQPVTIPLGVVESVTSNAPNCITIKGWAFDSHDPSFSVYIDIYAFRNRVARITANQYCKDIDEKYGVGNYHGFEETIEMPQSGTYNIAVYALNIDASKNTEIYYHSITVLSEEQKVILGDANGDGEVDSVDATVVQRAATMAQVPYSEEQLMCADIDDDGALTIVDATFIQRFATMVATPYNIGEPK